MIATTQASTAPIRDVVLPVKTWDPRRHHSSDAFEYIDISSVDRNSKRIMATSRVRAHEAPSRARQLVRANDVLVSTVRPNLNAVAIVPDELDGATASTGFCVLRSNPECQSHRYLFHWVCASRFVNEMVKRSTGANYPAVSDRIILDSSMPHPPLTEQKRIAAVLDQANAIRRRRSQNGAAWYELSMSIFIDMFGDPADFQNRWPIRLFDEIVADTQLGVVRGVKEMSDAGPYPYLRMDGIVGDGTVHLSPIRRTHATDDEVAESSLRSGDFLFNTRNSRELVGKSGVVEVERPMLYNNNIMRVRFARGVNPYFVNTYFQTAFAQRELDTRKSGTTSVFAIYHKSLKTMPVIVPPRDRQDLYAVQYHRCRALADHQAAHEAEADDLFNALVQPAFRGEL